MKDVSIKAAGSASLSLPLLRHPCSQTSLLRRERLQGETHRAVPFPVGAALWEGHVPRLRLSPRGEPSGKREDPTGCGRGFGKIQLIYWKQGWGLMAGNRDGQVGAEGMGSSARDHPSPPGTPRDSPALCFVLCFKFGSCCSSSGDGNIHQKKNPGYKLPVC